MSIDTKWQTADRISDRIVDVINEELEIMRRTSEISPLQLIAGQLLAFMATAKTAPVGGPASFFKVKEAAQICLEEMAHAK